MELFFLLVLASYMSRGPQILSILALFLFLCARCFSLYLGVSMSPFSTLHREKLIQNPRGERVMAMVGAQIYLSTSIYSPVKLSEN